MITFLDKNEYLCKQISLMTSSGEGELDGADLTEKDHQHNFHELVFIARGHGVHYIDGQAFKVSKGDVFLIQPGQHHYFQNRVNMRHLNIAFDFDALALPHDLIRSHPGFHPLFTLDPMTRSNSDSVSHLSFPTAQPSEIVSTFDAIHQLQSSGVHSNHFEMLTLYQKILIILMKAYAQPRNQQTKKYCNYPVF